MTCQRDEGGDEPSRGPDRGAEPLLTLEPLIAAVREGVEGAGWPLSGLQKTTSHSFEGRWEGAATRSAYLFFHRDDLPGTVSVEAFLDETSAGLSGNLTLVVEGPHYGDLGRASTVLERVAGAVHETLPQLPRSPLSLRLLLPHAGTPPSRAEVQLRVRRAIPSGPVAEGERGVTAFAHEAVGAFETLLERPEVAEFLPPVVD
jgi:hypothetical protein